MKSKAFIFIIAIVIVVAVAAYFTIGKKNEAPVANSGLVSQATGAAQGLPSSNVSASASQTGNQVVTILRNLSVIGLDDAVFRNPAFAYLSDISIILPPPTTPGRRNPFAAIGSDLGAAPAVTQPSTTTPASGTPQ